MRLDASPKSQIRLSYASRLCWVMVPEKYASSGGQGKHLVEGVFSEAGIAPVQYQ
jgi:hypothetical protein